jgi:hypothetical protein
MGRESVGASFGSVVIGGFVFGAWLQAEMMIRVLMKRAKFFIFEIEL